MDNNLPVINKPHGHRRSILGKYQRSLMIIAIAEMILSGKLRSDIVDVIHNTYGYSINTIKDLLLEAQTYAAKQLTPEERELIKNQIIGVGQDILLKVDNDNFSRLKAGELLSKVLGFGKPEIAIQQNIYNNVDTSKWTDEECRAIVSITEKKKDVI